MADWSHWSRWAALALALGGCTYGDDDDYDGGSIDYGSCGGVVARGVIDADAPLEVDPGAGVGIFVEYEPNGRWHVFTACDSDISGFACDFDVIVQPVGTGPIFGLSGDGLERSEDSAGLLGADAAQLLALTDFDTDGMFIDLDPGVPISIDAVLDGYCANQYIYWRGDGAIHTGAPSNPFELEPQ